MPRQPTLRHRKKISVTVDPDLLHAVDAFVAENAAYDRSKVLDDALTLWYAQQQDAAMEAQFRAPQSTIEIEERAAWRGMQADAAKHIFGLD